jgi:hypothetical protein
MHKYKYAYNIDAHNMQLIAEMVRGGSSTSGSKKKSSADITTVDFANSIYQKLTKLAQKNAMSTRKYANDLVMWNVQKYEMLERIYPFLNKEHVGSKSVFISDHRIQDKTVEVRLEYFEEMSSDKRVILKCLHCDKTDCEHVMFSLMLPEIGHLKID